MKRLLLTLFMSAACLFLTPTNAALAVRSVPVTGRVQDAATGKPIAGAMVGVYKSGSGTVKTDKRGAFRVFAASGKRIIYYDGGNPFYRSDPSTYTTVNVPSKGLKGVTLSLWRVEFGRGKVFDPAGMPLVGAIVTVCGSQFAHAVTDSKGRFKVMLPADQANPGG